MEPESIRCGQLWRLRPAVDVFCGAEKRRTARNAVSALNSRPTRRPMGSVVEPTAGRPAGDIAVPQGRRSWSSTWRRLSAGGLFVRGHDLAAWLGLVPRQITTGGWLRLLGISNWLRYFRERRVRTGHRCGDLSRYRCGGHFYRVACEMRIPSCRCGLCVPEDLADYRQSEAPGGRCTRKSVP